MSARALGANRLFAVVAVLTTLLVAACPRPHPADGALACSSAGECPEGYSCQSGTCSQKQAIDLAAVDLAAVDLAGIDLASRTNQCEMYCTCMMANCPASLRPEFDSALTCASYCTALPAGAQMDCRILHCALALSENDTVSHCPHARGIGMCLDL